MDSEYFVKLKDCFLESSKQTQRPLFAASPLFNMPYREVSSSEIRTFIYLYARFKFDAFSSFYNLRIPNKLINDMNEELRVAVQKNQDIGLAIHNVLLKNSSWLDPIAIEVYKSQRLPPESSDSFLKNILNIFLKSFETFKSFIGKK